MNMHYEHASYRITVMCHVINEIFLNPHHEQLTLLSGADEDRPPVELAEGTDSGVEQFAQTFPDGYFIASVCGIGNIPWQIFMIYWNTPFATIGGSNDINHPAGFP